MTAEYDNWLDAFRAKYLTEQSSANERNTMTKTPTAYEEILAIYDARNKSAEIARNLQAEGILTRDGAIRQVTDQAARDGWSDRLTQIMNDAEAGVQNAASAREALIQSMTYPAAADTTEALLNEMQISRAWARIRPALDASTIKLDVLHNVITGGDPIERAAILQEAPAYLETAKQKDAIPYIQDVLREADPKVEAAYDAERIAAQTRDITRSNVRIVSETLGHADELNPFHGVRLTDPSTAVHGFDAASDAGAAGEAA